MSPPPTAAGPDGHTVDDALWSAIGDPTRRRLLDLLLAGGRASATSLSQHLPVTRQAVAKHLDVLDQAGLVHSSTHGRERLYAVDDTQLARAVAQLATVGAVWDARLRRISAIAEAIQQQRNATTTPTTTPPTTPPTTPTTTPTPLPTNDSRDTETDHGHSASHRHGDHEPRIGV